MAVYRFQDDGIKDSMDALAGIMRASGEYATQRQDHELKMNMLNIASDPTLLPEQRIQGIYEEVANFKPTRATGLRGVAQGFGDFFAQPSQARAGMADQLLSDVTGRGEQNRQMEMERIINRKVQNLISLANATLDADQQSSLFNEASALLGIPQSGEVTDVAPQARTGKGTIPLVPDWLEKMIGKYQYDDELTPEQVNAQASPTVQGTPGAAQILNERVSPTVQSQAPRQPAPKRPKPTDVDAVTRAAPKALTAQSPSTPRDDMTRVQAVASQSKFDIASDMKKHKELYDRFFQIMTKTDIPDETILEFLNSKKD